MAPSKLWHIDVPVWWPRSPVLYRRTGVETDLPGKLGQRSDKREWALTLSAE
jgi:hypothetical protein